MRHDKLLHTLRQRLCQRKVGTRCERVIRRAERRTKRDSKQILELARQISTGDANAKRKAAGNLRMSSERVTKMAADIREARRRIQEIEKAVHMSFSDLDHFCKRIRRGEATKKIGADRAAPPLRLGGGEIRDPRIEARTQRP